MRVVSSASLYVKGGSIPGSACESMVLPEPGGPVLSDVEPLFVQVRESGKLAGAGLTGLAPDPANVEKLQRLTAALGL